MEALARLGLSGGYQVHVAPVALRPDLRAHQVFQDFSGAESIRGALVGILSDDARVWLDGEAFSAHALRDLPDPNRRTVIVPAQSEENPGGLYGLVWVVDRLLGPGGCPWDREQTHESLKRHMIEEAYELLGAIDSGSDEALKEELGDVLLQPVMHSQMRRVAGGWDIDAVATAVADKLIRRHPHVFGDLDVTGSEEVLRNWDAIKKQEKGAGQESILDGIPRAMPALLRAYEVSKRAARSGFEWPDFDAVWQKLAEEQAELQSAVSGGDRKAIEAEVGDLLFTAVNLARWAGTEPEEALSAMVDRFVRRFQHMEAAAGGPLSELSPDRWDELWEQAKAAT